MDNFFDPTGASTSRLFRLTSSTCAPLGCLDLLVDHTLSVIYKHLNGKADVSSSIINANSTLAIPQELKANVDRQKDALKRERKNQKRPTEAEHRWLNLGVYDPNDRVLSANDRDEFHTKHPKVAFLTEKHA